MKIYRLLNIIMENDDMITKQFADKCLAVELNELSEDKTLRDAISRYMQEGWSDDEIKDALTDNFSETVDFWADENNMSSNEMMNFILTHLNDVFKYDVKVDRDYDVEPSSKCLNYTAKEIKFVGKVIVDNVILDIEDWTAYYEIRKDEIVSA